MISVTVKRAPADKSGAKISNPLITTEAAARESGRNAIDGNCSSRKILTGTGSAKAFLPRGTVVEVHRRGQAGCRGFGRSWSLEITRSEDDIDVSQTVTIEVPVTP